MKILFLVPYPLGRAPSQRFRFEQYFNHLKTHGHHIMVCPFMGERTWGLLYTRGNLFNKVTGIAAGFLKRVWHLVNAANCDVVFIHREAAPLGPPIFEWIIAKLLKKPIVYDFDDAIWLPNTSEQNSFIAGIKYHQKVRSICAWSWKVSCGNQYLADFANGVNSQAVINPTTIDTESLHKPKKFTKDQDHITIGWTGTHSTSKYLEIVIPILNEIKKSYPFKFLVISNQDPGIDLDNIEFRKWNKQSEIDDLQEIDIGIMPLPDSEWAKGKCGFKALQFMALEIPVVASPVGVNVQIIDEGVNGYLADNPQEWTKHITELIEHSEVRRKMGAKGREKVFQEYSVKSNADNFLSLFTD